MKPYQDYYGSQIGWGTYGNGKIGRVYAGNQRGGGIGAFLGGLIRYALPLLTRGVKAVGKEVFQTGLNVLTDVTMADKPVKESIQNRIRESGEKLKNKAQEKMDRLMEGSGYKRRLATSVAPGTSIGQQQLQIISEKTKKKKKKKKKGQSGRVQKQKQRKKKKKKGKFFPDIFN